MKDYSCFNRQKGANVFPVTTHPASAHIPLLITPGGKAFAALWWPHASGDGQRAGLLQPGSRQRLFLDRAHGTAQPAPRPRPQKPVFETGDTRGDTSHPGQVAGAPTARLISPLFYEIRPLRAFYSREYGWRLPAPGRDGIGARWGCAATRDTSARRGGAATRSVTGHGCRDSLTAAEPPARPAQQGRGAPGRRERRAPHPQGGRRHHGRRGQVTWGPLPAGRAGPRGWGGSRSSGGC